MRKKGMSSKLFYPLLIATVLGTNALIYEKFTKHRFQQSLSNLTKSPTHKSNRYANRTNNNNPRSNTSNNTQRRVVSSSRGIHGVIAKELKQREDWNNEALKNLMDAHYIENRYEFIATNSTGLAMIKFETYLGSIANLNIISDVDNTPTNVLQKVYLPLKNILLDLNEEYQSQSTNIPLSIKISKMYEVMSENKRVTYNSRLEDFIHVEKVVDLVPSRPHHICSAYYALMTYYNIPVSMRFSHIKQGGEDLGPHAWLTIHTDTATFDLDPSIYKRFIPLDIRNPNLEASALKEEYVIRKEK